MNFSSCFLTMGILAPALLSAVPAQAQQVAPPAPQAKQNVLFIVADDLNTNIGVYGHPLAKTPNIDRLAARGVRFDNAFCQYPVCGPSRASFLSGLRPETIGVMDNNTQPRTNRPQTVFLPQLFRQNGYFSASSGKVFHVVKDAPSWDVIELDKGRPIEDLGLLLRPKDGQIPPSVSVGKATAGQNIFWSQLDVPDEQLGDGIIARRVAGWMEQGSRTKQPFFLAAGFHRPHMPLNVPKKYFDLYPLADISYPQEPAEHIALLPPMARKNATGIVPLEDTQRREAVRAYLASISFMDAQLGILLDQMDRLKLWDNTTVVFFGDHGFETGEHGGLWQKMVLFNEAARTPLIIAAPGKKPGVAKGVVELIDIYPTLTSLSGLSAPPELEGISLVPLLDNPNQTWKKAAFTVVGRRSPISVGRSVQTERFRYTAWPDGTSELYDHNTDPREYRNKTKDAASAALLAQMQRLLQDGPSSALPPNMLPTPGILSPIHPDLTKPGTSAATGAVAPEE